MSLQKMSLARVERGRQARYLFVHLLHQQILTKNLHLCSTQERCPDNSVGAHTESLEQVSSLTGFLEEVPAVSVDLGEREDGPGRGSPARR